MRDVATDFERAFGAAPEGTWSAPGRVNLVGEHTDYNGGASLPIAIDRRTAVAAALRDDDVVRVGTAFADGIVEMRIADLADAAGWSAYPLGVLWALLDAETAADRVRGLDLWIDSDVPVGVGVSSSAALEAAVCVAAAELWGLPTTREAMVAICQRAENVVAGAPTGTLDQSAALLSHADAALLLDFGADTVETVPLGLDAAGLAVLVIDSTVRHDHTSGGYGVRRRECEEAAALLGVALLADVPAAGLEDALAPLPEALARRARHVVTDTLRCREAAAAVRDGRPRDLGPILTAAHASMRDDFEASVPAVDAAADAAVAAGALGARITGGGFGGACIALVDVDRADEIAAAVTARVTGAGHPTPTTFTVRASAGAGRADR
ncbi:galactokinase [Agrococcus jejuensis]|uniref:galactokinase n=1 Tax=Agrococcus jejuensis TaxID=399736 RepID=UPI0011A9B55D|nr:galactokinase [Agrococcus jejuensis]